MFDKIELAGVFSTIFYTGLGLFLMLMCWWVIDKITHFSLHEELRKQNIAVAVLIGAIFIALAILISGVIRS